MTATNTRNVVVNYTNGRVFGRYAVPVDTPRADALRHIVEKLGNDLDGLDLSGGAYHELTVVRCNVSNSDFVRASRVTADECNFTSCVMPGFPIRAKNSNFTRAMLTGAELYNPKDSDFTGANLANAKFIGDCANINLSECDLEQVDFAEAEGVIDCGVCETGRIVINLRYDAAWVNFKAHRNNAGGGDKRSIFYVPFTELDMTLRECAMSDQLAVLRHMVTILGANVESDLTNNEVGTLKNVMRRNALRVETLEESRPPAKVSDILGNLILGNLAKLPAEIRRQSTVLGSVLPAANPEKAAAVNISQIAMDAVASELE